jgi:CHAT domain-containing protein/Flp pilus assembly protein TadD
MRRGFVLICLLPLALAGQPSRVMQEHNDAWRLVGQGKPDQALPILRGILTEDPGFYRAYPEVIEAFRQKGDVGGAERFFEELQSGFGRPEPHFVRGEILAYYWSGQPRKGWTAFQRCVRQLSRWPGCYLDVSRQMPDSDRKFMLTALKNVVAGDPANAAARFGLGEVDLRLKRYSEGVEAYERVLRQGTGEGLLDMLLLENLAWAVTASNTDWARGRAYEERALELTIQLGDHEEELQCLRDLTVFSFRLDSDASPFFERLVSRARQLDNSYALQQAYEVWGTLNRENGNANTAVEAYKHTLELLETLGRRTEIGDTLRKLAESEARRGDYQPALEHLERAEDCAKEVHSRLDEAFVLRSRGEIYVQLGDYARAIPLHQRARQILQDVGLFHSAGGDAGDLGIAYERLGDYERAEQWYRESLRSARRFADVSEQERILTLLAQLLFRQGNNAAAIQVSREALTLSANTHAWRFRANTLVALGRAYGRLGNFPEALKNLHAGLDTAVSLNNTELEFAGTHGLGEALLRSGRTTEAEREFRQALALGEQAGIPDAVRLAREGLGDVARQAGHLDDAATHYRAAIEAIESMRSRLGSSEFKTTFLSGAITAYERLIDVLAHQGRKEEALYVAEKARARAFLDMLAAGRSQTADAPAEPKLLDSAGIEQEMARRGAVLIEYALGAKRSYVWAVAGNKTVMAQLASRAVLEERARHYRELLVKQSPQAVEEATPLYQMLLAPIASQLVRNKIVVIVADGALHYLPFETLMPPGGRFLGEDFTVAYVPSASVLAELPAPSGVRRKELLAYGNPYFGPGPPRPATAQDVVRGLDVRDGLRLTPLPNTRYEVEGIAALYPTSMSTTHLGRAATKTSVQQENLTEYKRIHFATHAFIDERRPERSGIVLSSAGQEDGVLRINDILALKLNADLVVLSACQTGLGKLMRGEGISGLTRAFLFAGTPRVVASLWNVNDAATTDLMKTFYRKMQDGLAPARALQAAKLEMMRSGVAAYRAPYFWAAFVLVGEP